MRTSICRRLPNLPLLLCALGLPLTTAGCDPARGDSGTRSLITELERLHIPRSIGPRLSIFGEHRPCATHLPAEGTIPKSECAPLPESVTSSDRFSRVMKKAFQGAEEGTRFDPVVTAGVLDVLYGEQSTTRLATGIENLAQAARLTDARGPVLADLAGGHLLLAEETQDARSLALAIEIAAEAVELAPRNLTARFNLALALDRMALDEEAVEAWRDYLALDSTSGWAGEARARIQALSLPQIPAAPSAEAPPAEFAAYAEKAPQEARLLAQDTLLGQWGEAMLLQDTAAARAALDRASAVADALKRAGGDLSLTDMIRDIHAQAGNRATRQTLAQAHAAHGRGHAAITDRDWEAAQREFKKAKCFSRASPVLNQWARYFFGVSLFYQGKSKEAGPFFEGLIQDMDTLRHPALEGRTRWSVSTLLLRNGDFAPALREAEHAEQKFARLGERENMGAVQSNAFEAKFGLGKEEEEYRYMHRALSTLRPYRGSLRLHNHLLVTARVASSRGLSRTALYFHDTDVPVSERVHPFVKVEALLARAGALVAQGDSGRARMDRDTARLLLDSLPQDHERDWYQEDLRLAEAGALVGEQPRLAAAKLDSAVAYFSEQKAVPRLIPAHLWQAEIKIAAGDTEGATKDLNEATALLDSLKYSVVDVATRASMLQARRRAFDQLALLHTRAGRARDALAALERGRVSFTRGTRTAPADEQGIAAPTGQVVVDYALIGETLLIWTVADTVVRMEIREVGRDAFLRTVERAIWALETRSDDEAALHADLATLHDWLIRPVRPWLGGANTPLVVVADGEVAGAPFAALYDSARGTYLTEDHLLRFTTTLADAHVQPRERDATREKALFVADPEINRTEHPGLSALRKTAASIDSIASRYPGSEVISGRDATVDRLSQEIKQANVFHFGGHALFDDQYPARSSLVLAPQADGRDLWTARDIQRLDLSNLRLVVLSACETQRSWSGRSGGFASLSGAVLAAGADGVVGSLWKVNERLTEALMTQFHANHLASENTAGALRNAQLTLLRSPERDLRAPSAWAGFRYTGR